MCGQAKGRAVPRQAQGAPLCGKGPAPGTAREGASGAGRAPCMGKPPPAGAVQKSPLPHPAHLQISPHVSRPACYGGLFHPPPSEAWQPFRPTAGRFMGRGLLPVRSRRKEPAPLCAGKPPRQPGLCRKSPCLIRHIIQTSPHVSRPACHGGLFILHLLRRGNPSAPPPGGLWAAAFFPHTPLKGTAPLCAGKPASRGSAEKALASSGTSYRQALMSAARPAIGAFFIFRLLRRGNPSAPPPGGLWPRPSSRTQPLKGTAPLCAQSPRAAKAPSPAPPTRGRQAQGAPLYMGKPRRARFASKRAAQVGLFSTARIIHFAHICLHIHRIIV